MGEPQLGSEEAAGELQLRIVIFTQITQISLYLGYLIEPHVLMSHSIYPLNYRSFDLSHKTLDSSDYSRLVKIKRHLMLVAQYLPIYSTDKCVIQNVR